MYIKKKNISQAIKTQVFNLDATIFTIFKKKYIPF